MNKTPAPAPKPQAKPAEVFTIQMEDGGLLAFLQNLYLSGDAKEAARKAGCLVTTVGSEDPTLAAKDAIQNLQRAEEDPELAPIFPASEIAEHIMSQLSSLENCDLAKAAPYGIRTAAELALVQSAVAGVLADVIGAHISVAVECREYREAYELAIA